jgi:pimeloyl-ACP methyl ester carboxylesterase
VKNRLLLIALGAILLLPFTAFSQTPKLGAVVMHGKGGSPAKHVASLASTLEAKGILVSNLEMPWSGRREYDVDVKTADQEIEQGLKALRAKGASKVFVIGHSQGGAFALHFGSLQKVDGIVAIAPGGSTSSSVSREKLKEPLAQARDLVAQGKGDEKARLFDFEGSRGTIPLSTTSARYVEWFDPEGAMNQAKSSRALLAGIPVLYVAPTDDYAGLQRSKQQMFSAIPAHPLTRMIEPRASHTEAPGAAADEIVKWMQEVAQ